jgi:1-deoxy-D-xylulose-5-phosphate synthase
MSELSQMLKISRENNAGPFVIRYPAKDNFDSDLYKTENHPVVYGKGALLYNTLQDKNKKNVLIISLGQITSNCIDAAAALTEMCNASVYHARFLKPLDKNGIMNCIKEINPDVIVTAEDGVGNGGFGSSVATLLQKESISCKFDIISVPEKPVEQGSIEELYEAVGLDSIGIMKAVLKLL